MSCTAPFDPMPGAPGMLSIESPMSPSRSTSLSAGTPNLFSTHASSHHSIGHGLFAFHHLRILTHADDVRIANELAHVFVVRHDHGLHLHLRDLLRERADHV